MSDSWKAIAPDGHEVELWLDDEGNVSLEDPHPDAPADEIRDPRAKLKAETEKNERLSKKLTAAEAQRDEIVEQLKNERKQRAFVVAASAAGVTKIDEAQKLADLTTLEVGEDGNVTGAAEAVAAVVERYAFLVPDDTDESGKTQPGFQDQPSGAPMNGPRNRSTGPDRKKLIDKYSALRNRR